MPNHDQPADQESAMQDVDNAEKRERRIQELVQAGLARDNAELVDDSVKDFLEEAFAVHEKFLKDFQRKRPDLGLAFAAHSMSLWEANVTRSKQDLLMALMQRDFGIQIVELDSPEDLHNLLRGLFGE